MKWTSWIALVLPRAAVLSLEQQRIDRIHERLIREARRSEASPIDIGELNALWSSESGWVEEEIRLHASTRLQAAARRLQLPVPDFSEEGAWVRGDMSSRYYLSDRAFGELRALVRQERKERREGWVAWLTAITGVIGALTGLVAVWKP